MSGPSCLNSLATNRHRHLSPFATFSHHVVTSFALIGISSHTSKDVERLHRVELFLLASQDCSDRSFVRHLQWSRRTRSHLLLRSRTGPPLRRRSSNPSTCWNVPCPLYSSESTPSSCYLSCGTFRATTLRRTGHGHLSFASVTAIERRVYNSSRKHRI